MYKNDTGISLSMAVWLAHDHYDYNEDPNTISATSLIKSIRQIVLGMRAAVTPEPADIANLVQSRMGTAIHNGIEEAWVKNYKESLESLNYPQGVIDKIRINPTQAVIDKFEANDDEIIPVYLEQRSKRTIGLYTISGKFDAVLDGRLEDFKTTGTYTYVKKTNDKKYILQGSIYRWLNSDIITQDHMAIQFLFTDWKPMLAKSDPKYPKTRILEYKLNLMSINATQRYIENKVNEIAKYSQVDEKDLPLCTAEDLWQNDPVFKYYKNPKKTTRSTKNFNSYGEAAIRLSADGNVGIIVETKGEPTACKYCNAFGICSQKNQYLIDKTLKI